MNTYYTSEIIKNLRIKNNLTIQDVADYLGVSKVAVCKWEKGDDIKIEHLYSLAQLFSVSFSELFNGELNDESTSDYLRRDYNLSSYMFDEIDKKNMSDIQKYYECYSKINKRFYDLALKFFQNKISDGELKEYYQLKEFYSFDDDYIIKLINDGIIKVDENGKNNLEKLDKEKVVIEVLKKYSNLSKDELIWELSKFFNFNRNLRINDILESKNLKAIDYLFQNLNQQDKDYVFNNYLCYSHEEEVFGDDPLFIAGTKMEQIKIYGLGMGDELITRVMLKNKAHCFNDILFLYNNYEFDHLTINTLSYGLSNCVKGKKENDEYSNEVDKLLKSRYGYFKQKSFWKYFTLDEYNKIIDMNKTRYFKDELRLKKKDPLLYFNNVIHGKY